MMMYCIVVWTFIFNCLHMYSLLERQPCWFLMLNKTDTHTQKHTERERERGLWCQPIDA